MHNARRALPILCLLCLPAATAAADAGPSVSAPEAAAAAPGAPAPRAGGVELAFHYGLTQPLLLRGFNAAVDVRVGRFIASYSHGQGLDFSRPPGALSAEEAAAGLRVIAPYSTGGGLGVTLFRELYVMADLKVHHFEASAGAAITRYTTVTAGAEIGWRLFVWRGFHVTPVVRYWPTIWDSAPAGGVMVETADGGVVRHAPMQQGFRGLFANVLVGWAFDL